MSAFPLWASRLYNVPLALDRFKNDVLCEFAQQRISGVKPDKLSADTLEASQIRAFSDDASYYSDAGRKAFKFHGNIAVIPVRGTLVHKGDYLDAQSGLVGYNTIMAQARAASNDPEIKGMFMPYASGGGECAGLFAAAEELAQMAKTEGGKPIFAYLDENACSAAYVLASASDKIFGRRESMGGSISAIINLMDTSKAYEKAGLQPIKIRPEWADRKARGQGGEKIDAETIKTLTELVDEASDMIVEFVAAMRGISQDSVRALRGEVLTGTNLLRHSLIDDIISEREAWALLEEEVRSA